MNDLPKIPVKKGQIIKIFYKTRDFDAIVIDPDGLGKGQPSVGFGFMMMERYAGVPQSTLSTWGHRESEERFLKLPSGNAFRVIEIKGSDGNDYAVVEASDWFDLAFDILENPGRVSKAVKSKLFQFVKWFAIEGFYAEAYTSLKGVYTAKDSRVLSVWLQSRMSGIGVRNAYTDFLQSQGCQSDDYAYWTDYAYQGLFGRRAREMRQFWKLMEGDKTIGRNYIPESKGLEAVAYCEKQVIELFVDNLEQAHNDAISFTLRKFFSGSPMIYQ